MSPDDMAIVATITALGYREPKKLATGEWAALNHYLFTAGLCLLGERVAPETGVRTRFCYEHWHEASDALKSWDGSGDPPGPWIKEKGRVERLGPGVKP